MYCIYAIHLCVGYLGSCIVLQGFATDTADQSQRKTGPHSQCTEFDRSTEQRDLGERASCLWRGRFAPITILELICIIRFVLLNRLSCGWFYVMSKKILLLTNLIWRCFLNTKLKIENHRKRQNWTAPLIFKQNAKAFNLMPSSMSTAAASSITRWFFAARCPSSSLPPRKDRSPNPQTCGVKKSPFEIALKRFLNCC